LRNQGKAMQPRYVISPQCIARHSRWRPRES